MKKSIKFLALLAAVFLAACSQTFESTDGNSEVQENTKCRLAINVEDNISRTIMPTPATMADTIYSAVLTANDEEIKSWSGKDALEQIRNDESIFIAPGNYTFMLTVKNEAGNIIAVSKDENSIKAGNDYGNWIQFNLEYFAEGIGSFEVTLKWESEYIKTVKTKLYDCETDNELTEYETTFEVNSGKCAVYTKNNVPAGQYILKAEFYDGRDNLIKTYTEVLHIAANIKTNAVKTFTNFNTDHTIEYFINESWKSDFTPVKSRNVSEEVKLPTIENINTTSDSSMYALKWYTTQTFEADSRITKIMSGTAKDLKLYGRIEECAQTTADGFSSVIQKLSGEGPHNITVTGELTETQLKKIAAYIKNNSAKKINLDLGAISGLTKIDENAFIYCTSLTSVTIPDSVTEISDFAFDGCTSLTNVTIPNSITSIGSAAFSDCTSLTSVTIPNSITSIGSAAFYGCTSLTSVVIPDSVTEISDFAFDGCINLTSVTIPNSVTSIGDAAFYSCTGLTSITIPNNVTSIGDAAFCSCTSLTSIAIPNNVTSIGDAAFYSCTSLTNITVSENNKNFFVLDKCLYKKDWNGSKLILVERDITSVAIPDNVTSIGGYVFSGCTSLTNVTIPDSVTEIGDAAFEGCTSLTIVTIPDSITEIGSYAFQDCSNLVSIIIPDNVTSIDSSTFKSCTSLTNVTIPDSVTEIGWVAFSGCTSLKTVNYKGSEEQWKAISISNGNDSLTSAAINYNYTGE